MPTKLKYIKLGGGALVALAASLLQPLAQAQSAPAAGHSAMPGMSGSSAMAGGMDMKTMMKDMNEKMSSMPMTGNQDVDFAMMMRVHHQGAIDMAEAALRFGHDPVLRRLAQGIIVEQQQEIAVMRQALAALPPVVSSPVATSPHSHPTMNGMHK